MEAKALHDFKASSGDELSFEKGSIVKVTSPVTPESRRCVPRANNPPPPHPHPDVIPFASVAGRNVSAAVV